MASPIASAISTAVRNLGVALQLDNGTDVSIRTEFLDAAWGTGNKRIDYEALVYVNEPEQTVFMYEKTVETGSGLSFGGDSGSSFQSGTTLFRKVKSVQYGPDGKAYEYTLDLGAIPKAVKDVAKQNGFKFKTVVHRDKALWPAGRVPAQAAPAARSVAPQAPAQGYWGFCSNCGSALAAGARFCMACGKPTQPR
jgi:hypothetical protein